MRESDNYYYWAFQALTGDQVPGGLGAD